MGNTSVWPSTAMKEKIIQKVRWFNQITQGHTICHSNIQLLFIILEERRLKQFSKHLKSRVLLLWDSLEVFKALGFDQGPFLPNPPWVTCWTWNRMHQNDQAHKIQRNIRFYYNIPSSLKPCAFRAKAYFLAYTSLSVQKSFVICLNPHIAL